MLATNAKCQLNISKIMPAMSIYNGTWYEYNSRAFDILYLLVHIADTIPNACDTIASINRNYNLRSFSIDGSTLVIPLLYIAYPTIAPPDIGLLHLIWYKSEMHQYATLLTMHVIPLY